MVKIKPIIRCAEHEFVKTHLGVIKRMLIMTWMFASVFSFPGAVFSQTTETKPSIKIDVQLNSDPKVMAWEVHLKAKDLKISDGHIELRLQNWGTWDRADSLFLRNLSCNLKFKKVDNKMTRLRVETPADWNGSLEVKYQILMVDRYSQARKHFGLMPWYDRHYGRGFTSNTLMEIFHKEKPINANREIQFRAADDTTIVSGWGKRSRGTHVIRRNQPIDNTLIAFGTPTDVAEQDTKGSKIEIVQFGKGDKIAGKLLPKVADLVAAYSRTSGLQLKQPVKIYLTDTWGGGVNVDGAMEVGYDPGKGLVPRMLMTVAHELYHEWLGSGFVPVYHAESVWFKEGFTDYLALWHLAHVGHISHQQFLDRLIELNRAVQANTALGKISFGDPKVRWRDGDGPNEMMAYQGAALLAFFTDVELRKQGKPGVVKMISDFHKLNRSVSNSDIKNWYYKNGLKDFHKTWIEKPNFQKLLPALVSIGCKETRQPASVPYAGMQNDNAGLFGKIVAVDPKGAAQKAGVQVGDEISGFWPSVASRTDVKIIKEKSPKYPYGLTSFEPNKTIHFNVIRDGKEVRLKIDPVPTKGIAYRNNIVVADNDKFVSFIKRKQTSESKKQP